MTTAEDELQAKIKVLKDTFRATLEDRLKDVEATLSALCASDGRDAESLTRLLALVHKLTGSAGTFGFNAVSNTAGELEGVCVSLVEAGKSVSTADMDKIKVLAANLRKAAERETA